MKTSFLCVSSQLLKVGRLVLVAASASLISLATTPNTASAAGADGTYRLTGGSGFLKAAGTTTEIPKSVFKNITKNQAAGIVVKKNKIKIDPNTTAAFFQSLADKGTTLNPTVTGPTSLTLSPSGKNFSGQINQPIVTKFTVTDDGKKSSVTIKTYVSATVKGGAITLVTRFSGSDGKDKASGAITLLGKR
jgi:hypothetical protein